MAYDETKEFKTVGIACENYKVKRFREVLAVKGFQTKIKPGVTKDSALLQIKGVHIDKMDELAKTLNGLQFEFANRN